MMWCWSSDGGLGTSCSPRRVAWNIWKCVVISSDSTGRTCSLIDAPLIVLCMTLWTTLWKLLCWVVCCFWICVCVLILSRIDNSQVYTFCYTETHYHIMVNIMCGLLLHNRASLFLYDAKHNKRCRVTQQYIHQIAIILSRLPSSTSTDVQICLYLDCVLSLLCQFPSHWKIAIVFRQVYASVSVGNDSRMDVACEHISPYCFVSKRKALEKTLVWFV